MVFSVLDNCIINIQCRVAILGSGILYDDSGDYTFWFKKPASEDSKGVVSTVTNSIYGLFMTFSLVGLVLSIVITALYMIINSTNPRELATAKSRLYNTLMLTIVCFAIISVISAILTAIESVGLK